jgi:hypothetical protein
VKSLGQPIGIQLAKDNVDGMPRRKRLKIDTDEDVPIHSDIAQADRHETSSTSPG